MQRLTVKEVSTKPTKTGGTLITITDDKGSKMSGFEPTLEVLHPGDVIDADITVNGKFTNINGYSLVSRGSPIPTPVVPPATPAAPVPQTEQNLKSRAFALSYAKDLVVAGKIEIKQMFLMATDMEKWLSTGNLPGVK